MRNKLYIDGKWVEGLSGEMIDVINPATEEVFAKVPAANAEDIDKAVGAARKAFDNGPWPKMEGRERAAYLRAMGKRIEERLKELARIEVLDNGKPLPEAEWDIGDVAACFYFYADMAEREDIKQEEIIELQDKRFTSKAVTVPLGVVGGIVPWNYPMLMAAWKIAPALAAGCTIVLKPAEQTPLTALEYGAIADDVKLPAGVLNIVTGFGSTAGQALLDHRGVDKLAFTGSVPTGSKVMQAAARDIKRVSLELGGKSPFLVFEDSDIDEAVEWVMFGIFWNQGQVCSATSRLLVHEAIYDKFLEKLAAETAKITIGNGLDEGILLGPLVSEKQYLQVLAAIGQGKKDGAKILTGGKRAKGFDKGYFVEPTILVDVPLTSHVWNEEIFGPVVAVRPFETESEAVHLANHSRFGLAAAIMTKDLKRAERVAGQLKAGIIWINCSQPTFVEAPWGGFKQSGIGRELGRWGYENYREIKQITSYVSNRPWGWYSK
ncbi:aldehyde dehydrogenase family protein [Bartonella choladocola]|uniref:Betaine-aldehyde dehydrogenase n=1 Tax=Bartonella choladocola TaxID=2750995 RepID=A0A1U9MJE8_9HYPH|nr:aldehyde dehydrogenase family protein [Bartonella choladocola]AQT48034.1 betaine-aldehyde dehydrogenase [Bartonella choladocola]